MTVRPIYYQEANKEAERAMAAQLELAWNCVVHPFPELTQVDYYAARGKRIVAMIEMKARTHSTDKYPTLLLSGHKYLGVREAARVFTVPALLVVRFMDGLFYGDLSKVTVDSTGIAGRTDRGDPIDQEPCVFLCIRDLRPVGGNGE